MYLTQGLHRAVQQAPDEPATIFGERVRTWRQHAGRVARVAGGLRELGVTDGERVGILAGNSDRYLEVMSAVPWAGGVLNPLNARWSPRELGYALRESQTAILMADDAAAACLAAVDCPGLKTIVHLGDGPAPGGMLGYEDLAASAAPAGDARRGRDALAAIFYTGGTTGFPKGVMLSHANLVTSALGTLATVPLTAAGGRALLATQMFHLTGVTVWALQLAAGGSFVIVPAFEPRAVLAAVDQHRVTFTCLVPTMLQALLDHPEFGGYDLSSLRSLLYAGSPMSETLLGRVMKELPRAALTQAYGMTELAPPGEIRAHCQALIAGYKVPASFEFTDALPLSAAGKVLKRELRKPHWEGMDRQVH